MAKKQTRRSVSLETNVYGLSKERSASLGQSLSEYVTGLIRRDFEAAGLVLPPTYHPAARRAAEAASATPRTRPDEPEELGPAVALARSRMPNMDPKLLHALEHTRRQLEAGKVRAKPEQPVDKSKECHWCGDTIKKGEIPTERGDIKLHGKCHREMVRLGEIDR